MLSEEKFYDKAKDFVLLENTNNEKYTLEEYKNKVQANQTDKSEQLVYLYSIDADKQYSYIQAANRKDYDVLLLNSPIDSHFIGFIEQKLENTSLKRVDADVISNLIEKDEKIESILTEDQSKIVQEVFEKAIKNADMSVEITGQNPDELPVTVTMDEFMRRMKDMAKTGGGGMMNMYGTLPDKYKVTINGNHSLVQQILNAPDDKKERLARKSFDLALLSQNMLSGAALTDLINRSVSLMETEK